MPSPTVNVLLINGPNLNLLGKREPAQYGAASLERIERHLAELANGLAVRLDTYQSNAEHELTDRIQSAANDGTDAIVINPGAYTHTSIAMRDALAAVALPFVEVHVSNVYAREAFRHHSYFSDIASGVIIGLGPAGYELAVTAAASIARKAA